MMKRTPIAAAGLLALVLVACGGQTDTSSSPSQTSSATLAAEPDSNATASQPAASATPDPRRASCDLVSTAVGIASQALGMSGLSGEEAVTAGQDALDQLDAALDAAPSDDVLGLRDQVDAFDSAIRPALEAMAAGEDPSELLADAMPAIQDTLGLATDPAFANCPLPNLP